MSIVNDTLWVTESFSKRVSSFDLGGRGAKTSVVQTKVGTGADLIVRVKAGYLASVPSTELGKPGAKSVVVTNDGDLRSVISPFRPYASPLRYDVVQENVSGGPVIGRQVVQQPFQYRPLTYAFPNGEGFVSAEQMEFNTVRLTGIGLDGLVKWRATTTYVPEGITEKQFQQKVAELIAPTVVKGLRLVGSRKMILDSLKRPQHWPAFTAMILGADQSIWLKAGAPSADGEAYWRFSSAGHFEKSVLLPRGVRVMAVSHTYLYGTRRDSEGFPTIERFIVK